jgi:hypothetical protein
MEESERLFWECHEEYHPSVVEGMQTIALEKL